MSQNKRKIIICLIRIVACAAAVILVLVLGEYVLRLTGHKLVKTAFSFVTEAGTRSDTLPFYRLDPVKIYSIKKSVLIDDFTGSDEFGFRYQEHSATPTNNQYNIVAMGDSFTYGQNVKWGNAYPAVLEGLLKQGGIPAVVYNAGIPGYGPDQEYLYAKQILSSRKVDLLIWNFNMNDVNDSDAACLIGTVGNKEIQFPGWMNSLYLQGLAYQHLPPALLSLHLLNLVLFSPNLIFQKDRYTPFCTGTLSRDQILSKIIRMVNQIKEILAQKHARLLVTLLPDQFYFDTGLTNQHWSIKNHKTAVGYLKTVGADFIDLSREIALKYDKNLLAQREAETVAKAASSEPLGANTRDLSHLLFQDDPQFPWGWHHLNELGYQYFAQTVSDYMLNQIKLSNGTAPRVP